MFCKYCGSKLLDDAAFCHECGKATCEQNAQPVYQQPAPPVQPVQPQQPVYQPPVYQPPVAPQDTYTIPAQPVQQSVVQPVQQSYSEADQLAELQQQTLTFGILGICLSILGLPGFILSVIAAKKANAYKKRTGKVDGKVLVGYRLSKAGRAIGVVMTIVLYFLISALRYGTLTFDPILPDHFSGGGEF